MIPAVELVRFEQKALALTSRAPHDVMTMPPTVRALVALTALAGLGGVRNCAVILVWMKR